MKINYKKIILFTSLLLLAIVLDISFVPALFGDFITLPLFVFFVYFFSFSAFEKKYSLPVVFLIGIVFDIFAGPGVFWGFHSIFFIFFFFVFHFLLSRFLERSKSYTVFILNFILSFFYITFSVILSSAMNIYANRDSLDFSFFFVSFLNIIFYSFLVVFFYRIFYKRFSKNLI